MSGRTARVTGVHRLARLLAVAAAALLVSCGPPSPAPSPAPAVVWPDGPPTSAFESDPWVQAVREAEVELAVAVNTSDFSGADLNARWDPEYLAQFALQARSRLLNGSAFVYLGPHPFEPLSVDVSASGDRASVAGCAAPPPLSEERPSGGLKDSALTTLYTLELGGDGNRRIVGAGSASDALFELPDGQGLTDDVCATVEVKAALFDPAPQLEPLLELDEDDVIDPPAPHQMEDGEESR